MASIFLKFYSGKRKASFMGRPLVTSWITGKLPIWLYSLDYQVRAALDCLTVSYCCCRGRWSLTTARSHLPDSPPEFTAWDCSPLLPFATCAGLSRTYRFTIKVGSAGQSVCRYDKASRYAMNTIYLILFLELVNW